MKFLAAAFAAVALFGAAAPAFAQATRTADGMAERKNLRNARYCEVLLVKFNAGSIAADVYNTIGLNDCPAATWSALDTAKLAAEFKATRVILNGPRYFIMDRNALQSPGAVEHFDGLDARYVARLEIKAQDRVPYTERIVDRQSQYVYEAGKNVYALLSPDGHAYVMQSYSQEVEKALDEPALASLDARLKLPAGWKYSVRKLDADYTLRNSDGKAHVIQDDLKNTYQRED
jgi:hypothetical protein